MKKWGLIITFFLSYSISFCQIVTVGTGTDVNGTTEPGPANIWYRRTKIQMLYTAAELSAAGLQAGVPINQLGFYVEQVPAYDMPDYEIGLKNNAATTVAGNLDGGYTTVMNPFTYTPTAGGFDMMDLDQSFTWDGTSSIVFQICWSQVQPNYDASGQTRRYAYTNGFKYSWTDNAGNSCGDNANTTINTKPIVRFIHNTEAVWTGNNGTNWNDAGNWDSGIPNEFLDARIPTGLTNYPNVPAGMICKDLNVENGATVTMNNSGDLSIHGNWDNQGIYIDNGGTINLIGTAQNQLSGVASTTVNNLVVNNSNGAAITSGNWEIATELDVQSGTFTTNNALKINSNSSGTGRIAPLAHSCTYTLDMSDTWGDGWNGGFLTVTEDGNSIGTFAAAGTGSTETFSVESGATIVLNYTSGAWENENSYTLDDPTGTQIFSDGTNPTTGDVFTTTATCAFNNPIIGEITMERYIDAGETYWRYFSSAVQGATVQEYQDDFTTAGYPGSPFPDFGWNSIYTYDETLASGLGYVPVSSSAQVLGTGQGYFVWSGDTITGTQPFTVDLDGPVNAGPIDFGVTYTAPAPAIELGWNYIGNPYPSTIDWSDNANWTKTNMGDAVYVLDPDSQNMTSYVNGASTNGGSPLIASQQGFWVFASAASPQLIIRENAKSNVDQAFWKSNFVSSGMKIKLTKDGVSDEVVIRHVDATTDLYDSNFDAIKVNGSNANTGQLSIVNEDDLKFAIQSKEFQEWNEVISLGTEIYSTGEYTFTFDDIDELNFACMKLHDLSDDSWYDIYEGAQYSFDLNQGMNEVRFEIVGGSQISNQVTHVACNEDFSGKIEGQIADSMFSATLLDQFGNETAEDFNNSFVFDDLAAGVYQISFTGLDGVCENQIASIEVFENDQIEAESSVTEANNVFDINLSISGGTAPYSVSWLNGESGIEIQVMDEGWFTYVVTDDLGCEITDSVYVESVLGIDDHVSNDDFNFNHEQGLVTYDIQSIQAENVVVRNVLGQTIYSGKVSGSNGNFNLGKLSPGIYEVQFYSEKEEVNFRLVNP